MSVLPTRLKAWRVIWRQNRYTEWPRSLTKTYRHRQGDLDALVNDAQTIQLELKRCLDAVPAVRESIAMEKALADLL